MLALPSLWFGTDICQSVSSSNGVPSGVLIDTPTPGVEPLKNLAMSASVPVGTYSRYGATVTTMRDDRSTSPAGVCCAVQPVGSGFAEIPKPGADTAYGLSRLKLTRTTFGAYGSTSTVAAPRARVKLCAPVVLAATSEVATPSARHTPRVVE